MAAKEIRLGRGLDTIAGGKGIGALLGDVTTSGSASLNEIDLSKIQPNPDQPRTIFDEESLEELAVSIRDVGIITPITVREVEPDKYVIIAGERRYRASLKAGLKSIPAYVKKADENTMRLMALLENIQREDLNAIEIALGYQKLIETLKITQEQLSEQIGKKRSTIANYVRLLELPAAIQMSLKNKEFDMGHARALIPVEDPEVQLAIYEEILKQGLSVRAVEEMVRLAKAGESIIPPDGGGGTTGKNPTSPKLPEEFKVLRKQLSDALKTKVQMTYGEKGKGKITIPFASDDELVRLMDLLGKLTR